MVIKIMTGRPVVDADKSGRNETEAWVGKKPKRQKVIIARPGEQKRKITNV